MAAVVFEQVRSRAQKEIAGVFVREYLASLNARLLLEYATSFDAEGMVRSDLSDGKKFYPPDGRFYLARYDGHTAGIGCLKKLESNIGEIQRMYVRPAFRGNGLGRAIATRLIEEARRIGYRRLRLESLEFLTAAHGLYRSLGFRDIDPYDHSSMRAYQRSHQLDRYFGMTVFMELEL